MSKNLEIKKELISKTAEDIKANKKTVSAVVFDYSKLSSNELNELRSKLFEVNTKFKVIKNTLIKRLLNQLGIEIETKPQGQNAIMYTNDDFIKAIKTIADFIKEKEKGKFKMGILKNNIITDAQVNAISKLPSKEVLIGQFASVLNANTRDFVSALNGVQGKFVRALKEISKQKS